MLGGFFMNQIRLNFRLCEVVGLRRDPLPGATAWLACVSCFSVCKVL